MAERDIQGQIVDYLGVLKGVRYVRVPVGAVVHQRHGKMFYKPSPLKGFPDLMGWMDDGTPFYIEVKTIKGRLRSEQQDWKEFFESKPKCIYIVARSVMDVVEGLRPYVIR